METSGLAASIGRHNQYGWIERQDWELFAKECGLDYLLVNQTLRDYATKLPAMAESLLTSTQFLEEERQFLEHLIHIMREHCGYVLDEG